MGLKVDGHIYENSGELRDATPDLILAVKPKVPLDGEQVSHNLHSPGGSQVAERLRNRACNQKVAGSIPGRVK